MGGWSSRGSHGQLSRCQSVLSLRTRENAACQILPGGPVFHHWADADNLQLHPMQLLVGWFPPVEVVTGGSGCYASSSRHAKRRVSRASDFRVPQSAGLV